MNDQLNSILQGLNMDGLINKMESLQKTHVTVGSITFDKSELKRAEPIKQNDTNCTKITWKDNSTSIIEVSKMQFDKEFNK
jgi:hypothetical protein